MAEPLRRPKVVTLGEPDAYLRDILHCARLEEAGADDFDFMLYPRLIRLQKGNHLCSAAEEIALAARMPASKPIIVFVFNDFEGIVYANRYDVIVLRNGISRIWKLPNEIVLPFVWIVHPDDFSPRRHSGKPVLGFCGTIRKRRSRRATLEYMRKNDEFDCNFIVRDKFWAEGLPQEQAMSEFVENLENSDFIICDRGRGNWTVRMYEALSRGRVPAMLDTGFTLPELKHGSWDDTIIVARTRRQLAEAMLAVWESGDMAERQKRCRALWSRNFSIPSFTDHLALDLAGLASDPSRRKRLFSYRLRDRLMYALRSVLHMSCSEFLSASRRLFRHAR